MMKKLAVFGIAIVAALGLLIAPTVAEELSVDAMMKAHINALGAPMPSTRLKP